MASAALSETLASMPATPPEPAKPVLPESVPTHNRNTRSKAATTMGPPATVPAPGTGKQSGSPAGGGPAQGAKHVSKRGGATQQEPKLGVLKDCTIFVDVRTDEGQDAGGLFSEMLQGLGARVCLLLLLSQVEI